MALASVWRTAWMRSRVSSTTPGGVDGDGNGGSLQPTCGGSTTSGTTCTTTTVTVTTSSDSTGERPRDFNSSMVLPTVPVVEENVEVLHMAKEVEEDRVRKLEHLMGLVVEFHGGNNLSALEKWLSELDVGWVLHEFKIDGPAAGSIRIWQRFHYFAESWILALQDINVSISIFFDVWRSSQDRDEGTSKKPLASEFALLVEAAVLKMLPFVDAIIASAARINYRPEAMAVAKKQKLQVLIDMSDALSMASEQILSSLFCSSSPCVESTDGMMRYHMSIELGKLDESIWGTTVDMKTGTTAWMEGNGGFGHPCGSSDIHNVTRSVISDTKVLWANYGSLNRILHCAFLHGEFMPENENVSHLTNLIMEMVRSIEDKLARNSQCWFPDESLRLLFLINNSFFMLQQLHTIWSVWRFGFPMPDLTRRIDDYINGYLQVSWAPVLKCLHDPATPRCFTRRSSLRKFESIFHKTYAAQKLWKVPVLACLFNPTPRRLGKRYSPLPKFESEFQKTYTTQKLWKVPDPRLRKTLREAIIEKIIPGYTKYIEENKVLTTPKFTPQNLEDMLQELFEG